MTFCQYRFSILGEPPSHLTFTLHLPGTAENLKYHVIMYKKRMWRRKRHGICN